VSKRRPYEVNRLVIFQSSCAKNSNVLYAMLLIRLNEASS